MQFSIRRKALPKSAFLSAKTLLIMKLTIILSVLACLQVNARGYSQNITLNERGAPLAKIFREIRLQSGYGFWYEDKLLIHTRKVDIHISGGSLKEALDLCFMEQPVTYEIIDNTVVIKPLPASPAVVLDTVPRGDPGLIEAKGKVVDEKGASIAGATITEKNTRNATTSREDGSFSIKVKNKARLIISYVGYESFETSLSDNPNIHVSLIPDTKSLSDVVVTGIGVATSKKKVPIDVATVSSRDFAKSATTSIEQALSGQVAGAQVQQTSGKPGSGFNITLRGINSLDGTYPLILVDGVEMRDLTSLDPASVERIEVVKGAAGGMLYGAQGANGIIQVFTKKGALNSRLSINFSSKASIDNVLLGKNIFASHHHYITDPAGSILDLNGHPISQDPTGLWGDPQIPDPGTNPGLLNDKPYKIPLFDHLKQAYRQALTFTNSVSITGGNANADYALTASQLNQQDVFSNAFSRTNLSLNLGIQPFKGFSFRSITQVIAGYENLLNGNRYDVITAYPWIDFNWRDSTGHRPLRLSAASNQQNSLSEQEWHQRSNQTLEIFQNFNFNYKFPRFLELDFKYGMDYLNSDATSYFLNQSAALQKTLFWGPDRQGSLTNTFNKSYFQNGLTSVYLRTDFEKDFKSKLPIRTTTQVTYDYRTINTRMYFAQGIQLPVYPPVNISSALTKTDGDGYSAFTTFGVLFNQTIEYGNLWGISGGLRSDYGSTFGAAYKAATFPRGTIYIRPSEWMSHIPWIVDWKVRGAYGEAGIQPRGFYDRQTTLVVNTLGNGVGLSIPTRASNDSLQLATSKELEIGTDITVSPFGGEWLHKVSFSGTWWTRKTSGVYQSADVAPSTGYANRFDNLSDIDAKGLDLSLDAVMLNSREVTWNMGVRWGFTQSKVTKISNGLDIIAGEFAVKQGQHLGLFYGQTPLHSVTQLQVDGKTPYIPPGQQGNYTVVNGAVVNMNTNSVVLTAKNDLSVIGKAYPDFTSSLINTIGLFHTLTISFQFDWVHGNNIYNLTRQWLYTPAGGSGGFGQMSADYDKPVTINGKTGAFVNYYQSLYNLVSPLSTFSENGSYIRLRDLSISYDLKKLVKTPLIKRCSVTLSGRNLLTFTKFSGWDPENTGAFDSQGNTLTGVGAFSGVDYFGVPNLRSYQFSMNIGF